MQARPKNMLNCDGKNKYNKTFVWKRENIFIVKICLTKFIHLYNG